jgi:hypothetical protein
MAVISFPSAKPARSSEEAINKLAYHHAGEHDDHKRQANGHDPLPSFSGFLRSGLEHNKE